MLEEEGMKKILFAMAMLAYSLLLATKAAHADPACVTAIPPDGDFLNLRMRPDAQSEILTKILQGQILYFSDDVTIQLFRQWVHVYGVEPSRKAPLSGWVSRKYIKPTKCPEKPYPSWLGIAE